LLAVTYLLFGTDQEDEEKQDIATSCEAQALLGEDGTMVAFLSLVVSIVTTSGILNTYAAVVDSLYMSAFLDIQDYDGLYGADIDELDYLLFAEAPESYYSDFEDDFDDDPMSRDSEMMARKTAMARKARLKEE